MKINIFVGTTSCFGRSNYIGVVYQALPLINKNEPGDVWNNLCTIQSLSDYTLGEFIFNFSFLYKVLFRSLKRLKHLGRPHQVSIEVINGINDLANFKISQILGANYNNPESFADSEYRIFTDWLLALQAAVNKAHDV